MIPDRNTRSRKAPCWRPRSLRQQLLLGVLAVVTVVLVAVGVVSVLSLSGYVTAMNDAELVESLHALNHSYTRYRDSAQTSTPTGNLPMSQAVLEFTGQTPGNLIAVLHDGVVIGSAVFSEDGARPAPPDVIRAIEAQVWDGGPPRVESLGSLSHELRTPLAAIQGYAELTRQDSSDLPPTTEYALARIESEARRMTLLVDELLLLSRLSEGEDLETEDLDLTDLVINAVNDAAVAAPTHRWVKNLPDEPVWVNGDHARLHQLVSNLLTNAWVHTQPGVTVTIGITCHRTGPNAPCVELSVTDDGPDIDPEILPHLFDRFVRASKSRSNGSGHGLGLAIVSSIVKAHRGSVTAESGNGQTVFRVRLPMIEQQIATTA